VVVKADAGTYGMGVMTVKDASQVTGLNRKQRNKMSVIKEGLAVSQVIIQEGVHSYERVGSGSDEGVAEPVVYMIDRFVVGGFYRVHSGRGKDENLNAPGMHFEPLAFETSCSLPDHCQNPDAAPNRFYAYGVVARLAQLAASLELERTAPDRGATPGMRIAFIVDPLPSLKAYKDTSIAMMRAAQAPGTRCGRSSRRRFTGRRCTASVPKRCIWKCSPTTRTGSSRSIAASSRCAIFAPC
jgi:hypothetical protein